MADRAYVATRKGLFTVVRTSTSGPPRWQVEHASFLGDNVTLVMPDRRDGRLYAALDHGHFGVKLHRSADRGDSWEACSVPAYPEPPGGKSPDRCPMSGIEIPWALKLIWALAPGGPDEPGSIWCGTVPGALFRSTDRGDTWTVMTSLWNEPARRKWFGGGLDYPGIHSICVDPRDARHVTVGVSCGGVWVTRDRGESWKCQADGMRAEYLPPDQAGSPDQQDPHCLVQSPSHPDVFWVQHHNGIFRSVNGSQSWEEIRDVRPSVFGFAVAVHPANADVAWFVPAIKDEKRIPEGGRVVVTRTRDGGKSFQILTDGLPARHAYDLVFRHALDVDGTGDRLIFGSTTGSVWVTEDGGDHWSHVTGHLPPVHCVRFE